MQMQMQCSLSVPRTRWLHLSQKAVMTQSRGLALAMALSVFLLVLSPNPSSLCFPSCSGLEGLVGCHQRLRSLLVASACALLYAVSSLADRRMSVLSPEALIF